VSSKIFLSKIKINSYVCQNKNQLIMEKEKVFRNADLPKSLEEFQRRTTIPKIRNEFIAQLEHSLMYLSYPNTYLSVSDAISKFNLKTFDGAWLSGMSLRHSEEDAFMFAPFGDLQVSPDMFPNMNVKTLNLHGGIATLEKHRFLNPKEKRHLQNFPYITQHRYAYFDNEKNKWYSGENGYGIPRNFTKTKAGENVYPVIPTPLKAGYVMSPQHVLEYPGSNEYLETLRSFHAHLQLAMTQYYEWTCFIRETPNSVGIRIPIHPSASKEVFMMRNIPEGAKRKRAIVNYVKDHYRTVKGLGNEREILIKKHFRGDLKFNWRGLEVHVTPSPYDLNRIKTTKVFSK
jgi:hypothetical protein